MLGEGCLLKSWRVGVSCGNNLRMCFRIKSTCSFCKVVVKRYLIVAHFIEFFFTRLRIQVTIYYCRHHFVLKFIFFLHYTKNEKFLELVYFKWLQFFIAILCTAAYSVKFSTKMLLDCNVVKLFCPSLSHFCFKLIYRRTKRNMF